MNYFPVATMFKEKIGRGEEEEYYWLSRIQSHLENYPPLMTWRFYQLKSVLTILSLLFA